MAEICRVGYVVGDIPISGVWNVLINSPAGSWISFWEKVMYEAGNCVGKELYVFREIRRERCCPLQGIILERPLKRT